MNFNFQNTEISKAVRLSKNPLFKFSNVLSKIFWVLFLISLCLFILSFSGSVSSRMAINYTIASLGLYFVFFNLDLFFNVKIKKPQLPASLEEIEQNLDAYNLADFLSFESAKIIENSMQFCKKKKIKNNSTVVFYSAVKISREIQVIIFRLGINIKKLQDDLKNYLEKIEKGDYTQFSDDFENVIKESLKSAQAGDNKKIREEDIFIALSKHNEFFKKVLVEYDLKKEDVENISYWLESIDKSFRKSKKFWTKENLARYGSFGKDFASGYTLNLDKFSTDWRRVVSKWYSKEIIGHEKEVQEVEAGLAKSGKANVLVVGDSGTGRRSIIESLAQKCFLGSGLPELASKRVVELDMVALTASIENPERLEFMLDNIFAEVILAGNVILVIDNLDNFVGLKQNKPGQVDISAILSKYLAMPNFYFVGVTSFDGLHKHIEENSSFVEFFKKVEIQEVTEAGTIRILQNSALEAEYKHKMFVLYPSLREIVNLTGKYMPSLHFPEKALDLLSEVVVYVQSLREKVVMPHHVAELVSKKTEIPVGKMEVKEKEVLMNLENLIHQRLVNQEEAVKEISVAMRRARAGLSSKKRPMGTFLFMGPTGVGKTETAKALSQIYFGSEEKMIRIDMSEFQSVTDIPRLIGQTSPVELQGLLTTQVRESPFSLILLDEIEKAYPDILNLFLQILDEGSVTDGQGRKIVFTNTIIICTSNAGAPDIFKAVEAGEVLNKDKILDNLFDKKIFKPEFINRFDATVLFHPLTKDNLMKIAQLSLQSLQKNLKEKEIDFEITEELKERIVDLSYKPAYGAREMRRVIQDKIENTIAENLISEKIKKGDKIEINPDTFEIAINPVK